MSLIILFRPAGAYAEEIDTTTAGLTHPEFIEQALTRLTEEILAGRDSTARHHPGLLIEDSGVSAPWICRIWRNLVPAPADTAPVIVCRVYQLEYALVEKTRRRLGGPWWISRRLRVGLHALSPTERLTSAPPSTDIQRSYLGWFRAADAAQLATGDFATLPLPPSDDLLSRWAAPVAVGVGLGVLTYLFFSVR